MITVVILVLIDGIIVTGKVWNKRRPVIIAKSDEGGDYYFGVSHSTERKNMKPLGSDGIEGLEIDENTCYGLCNKPSEIGKQIGTITNEKEKELIDSLPDKKRKKREKYGK